MKQKSKIDRNQKNKLAKKVYRQYIFQTKITILVLQSV